MQSSVVGFFLLLRSLIEFSLRFGSRPFLSFRRILKSLITPFALLTLAIVVSCSKPKAPLETSDITPTYSEMIESIRNDLKISQSDAIEILHFESIWTDGGRNARESATILLSTDNNFQLALIYRKPTNINQDYRRWSILSINISLVDGTGETVSFERKFDNRPTNEDIEAFKKWIAAFKKEP